MTHRDGFLAYLRAYEARDIAAVGLLMADDITLRDWKIRACGKPAALAETQANFAAVEHLQIEVLRLYEAEHSVAGELRIVINQRDELFVVDTLDFNAAGQICAIRAFVGRGDNTTP